jgi:hypothetical protein
MSYLSVISNEALVPLLFLEITLVLTLIGVSRSSQASCTVSMLRIALDPLSPKGWMLAKG